jgi:hypothetical protein
MDLYTWTRSPEGRLIVSIEGEEIQRPPILKEALVFSKLIPALRFVEGNRTDHWNALWPVKYPRSQDYTDWAKIRYGVYLIYYNEPTPFVEWVGQSGAPEKGKLPFQRAWNRAGTGTPRRMTAS